MKSLFSILLSIFILLQGGIFSVQYVFRIANHKKAVKAAVGRGVYDNDLVSFSSAELLSAEWENGHEFFLGGEKYDVVRKHIVNGELSYACINDKKEKALINGLAKSGSKSTLLDEIIKKINLQLSSLGQFTMPDDAGITEEKFAYFLNQYDFIFSRVIIKPPVYYFF